MMLIELMISIVLSLSIFSLLLSDYFVSSHLNQTQRDLQNVQYRAIDTINILTHAIKKAGWIGCRQLNHDFSATSYVTIYNRLTGKDNYIQIRNMSDVTSYSQTELKNASLLFLDQALLFSEGELGIIADCFHAEIFQVKSVSRIKKSQIIILTKPLEFNFKINAEIGKLEINEYFFDPIRHGLYIKNLHHKGKSELVTEIENINIKYSILKNNELIDESFEEISDWSLVKGVAITLTFNVLDTKKNWYTYVAL